MNSDQLREHLCDHYPHLCPMFSVEFGDGVLTVEREALFQAANDLRDLGFDRLGMVTAVDWVDHLELVYRLTSRAMTAGIFIKCRLSPSQATVPSLVGIWPAALWQEREVFDLFGIVFEDHPDLRRILLPDDWEGHPLRKDYTDPDVIRRPDYI